MLSSAAQYTPLADSIPLSPCAFVHDGIDDRTSIPQLTSKHLLPSPMFLFYSEGQLRRYFDRSPAFDRKYLSDANLFSLVTSAMLNCM